MRKLKRQGGKSETAKRGHRRHIPAHEEASAGVRTSRVPKNPVTVREQIASENRRKKGDSEGIGGGSTVTRRKRQDQGGRRQL